MANLEFQDFHETRVEAVDRRQYDDDDGADTYEFQHSDRGKLLGDSPDGEMPTNAKSWWSFEYYQQFFDVDTHQVMNRLLYSCTPRVQSNFITDHIRPSPDLYGPFWICVTLVFTVAIGGNLSSYIQTAGSTQYWHYNFHHVTAAAGLISAYILFVPLALYWLAWYRKLPTSYSYLELLCVYGYSLALFIPVAMLMTVNYEWFRWTLVLLAVFVSGCTLVFSLKSMFKDDTKAMSMAVIIAVVVLHLLLAITFKQAFFASGSVKAVSPLGGSTSAVKPPSAADSRTDTDTSDKTASNKPSKSKSETSGNKKTDGKRSTKNDSRGGTKSKKATAKDTGTG